jgi:flagellar M-ring protein FliF
MKFKEIFEMFGTRVKDVLGKLSPSQRMSIALLAGVVVLSFVGLIFLSLSSSGGDWEKLFYVPLEPERQQYVINRLGTAKFKIEDDCIMVRSEERARLAAIFHQDPEVVGEKDWFEALFEQNFMKTDAQRGMELNYAIEKRLSTIIGYFKDIKRAYVGINPGDSTAFLNHDLRKPTASVSIELRSGIIELGRETVISIARTVAGQIKGLNPQDVSISDFGGNYYHVPSNDDEQPDADFRLRVLRSVTSFFDDRVRQLFKHYPGFGVATYVKIDWKSVQERILTVPGADELPKEETTETSTGGTSETGGPPGISANIEAGGAGVTGDVSSGRGGQPAVVEKKLKIIRPLTDKISEVEKQIISKPGDYTDITVTVSVPYNILVRPLDSDKPVPEDPAERERVVQENIDSIKKQIKGPTGITDLTKIIVAASHAISPPEVPGESVVQQIWDFGRPLVGKVLLAGFALAALFLVASFVKKNIPKPQQIPIEEIEEKIEKEVAKEKKDFLTELEKMDESEMKAVQVKDRVEEMVKENPESAAGLLKTWIYKEE